MITSPQNPKIKSVRALQSSSKERRAAQAFVIEGVRLLEEALAAGWQAELVLYTAGLEGRARAVLEGFAARGCLLEEVSAAVLRAASDTETPQGLLAVVRQRPLPPPDPLHFAFIPDSVRDPGNLGTMLRTAAAAGVATVFLPPGTVDAFAPKVLRAGMGAHFRLPLQVVTWEAIAAQVQIAGLQVYLAAAEGGLPYTQADFRAPLALLIGGEAAGAGPQGQRLAQTRVHIPMPGGSESLNAAIAAAVLLFEVVRQRQTAAPA